MSLSARPGLIEVAWLRSPPTPLSTWSCTRATWRGHERSTPGCAAGARSGSTPAAAGIWRFELGGGLGGGIVECQARRPLWLPYVEVADVAEATERARLLGASVLLEPREGPAGWRSVVAAPAGGEIAFWQPKEQHR